MENKVSEQRSSEQAQSPAVQAEQTVLSNKTGLGGGVWERQAWLLEAVSSLGRAPARLSSPIPPWRPPCPQPSLIQSGHMNLNVSARETASLKLTSTPNSEKKDRA